MSVVWVLLALVAVWLLWRIARNTADALDRQAALQVELVALNRRLGRIEQQMPDSTGGKVPDSPQ